MSDLTATMALKRSLIQLDSTILLKIKTSQSEGSEMRNP